MFGYQRILNCRRRLVSSRFFDTNSFDELLPELPSCSERSGGYSPAEASVQTYSQQHGYSAVIERGSDAAPVVWYAAGNLDITDELIKAYNAQSPAGPAALPSAPHGGTSARPEKTLPDSPSPHPQ